MREIKFRALQLDSPSGIYWVYGSYVMEKGYFERNGVQDISRPVVRHYIYNKWGVKYDIAEQTLGQFTGLHDCEGREIWEGDIVSRCIGSFNGKDVYENYEIKFKAGGTFGPNSMRWCLGDLGNMFGGPELKVIGNIHENPELLNES